MRMVFCPKAAPEPEKCFGTKGDAMALPRAQIRRSHPMRLQARGMEWMLEQEKWLRGHEPGERGARAG